MKERIKDEVRKVKGEDINIVSITEDSVTITLKCGGYIEVTYKSQIEER